MRRRVVTMDQKLAVVFADVAAGRVNVAAVCAELSISRDTYYRYKRRFAAEGVAGLTPRSRAPKTSPARTGEAMTEAIVAVRKQLEAEGWDNGALSIESRLLFDGVIGVPCARTIHRVLVRAGLVEREPGKRPRSSFKRFVFPATDDCWQIDAYEYRLDDPDATVVVVFEIIDDHSRYHVAGLAWPCEDTEGAWKALSTGIDNYGKPRMVLSDNGLAFTGRRVGKRVLFEKNLAALGIKLINSRPCNPRTNGKNERAHRTARKWLAARRPGPATLAELQTLLDTYRTGYNNRPHQGIDRDTPLHRRVAGTRPEPPAAQPISSPHTDVYELTASSRDGYIKVQQTRIPLGPAHAGQPITVFITGDHAVIFHREQLLRELTIDRTLTRQPSANPRHKGAKRRTLT